MNHKKNKNRNENPQEQQERERKNVGEAPSREDWEGGASRPEQNEEKRQRENIEFGKRKRRPEQEDEKRERRVT